MAIKKLYGTPGSPATMRALASIFEHELDFEFIPIDLKAGEQKKETYLSLNPFGQVPVYQDEDLTLFDSRAIMRFISHHYAKPGKEQVYELPLLQGRTSTWIDVEAHQFDPPGSMPVQELVFKPKNGLPTDKAAVEDGERELAKVLDVYEERLKDSKYLGGDKFTSADLSHLPILHYLIGTSVKRLFDKRPCVKAWSSGILGRPAWAKLVEMMEVMNKNV